ncbi:hypothetical protein KFU94_23155 [Chloroflexi bacterium TSY]|nr:hypothetical protein [Chloroflexi bacterium TSY]
MRLLPAARAGQHTDHPAVQMVQTCKLDVTSRDGMPIHADGELLSLQAFALNIDIQPQRLTVIAPS